MRWIGLMTVGAMLALGAPKVSAHDITAQQRFLITAGQVTLCTPIVNLQRDGGQILLQGYENKRAFSFLIDEKTGWMTVAIARKDLSVTVFGACTPKTAGE